MFDHSLMSDIRCNFREMKLASIAYFISEQQRELQIYKLLVVLVS